MKNLKRPRASELCDGANILTHSYHLDDKDVTDSNKIKLKNFFEEITIGTEFYFNHQCCSGRGIMFDTIEK